ncbi:MAG: FAD-dependent thymidylate synthase [Pseudomonadota bacterium]
MTDDTDRNNRLERLKVADLDEILGASFQVLDDGFVRVIDYMGSDAAIVQAARVSYGAGTKKVQEDRGLIRYLMRHRHTTPLEMCEIKLHVRVPMDTWRQWIRHRTANVNEYSTRYSVAIDGSQKTLPGEWREQSTANKQGSGGFLDSVAGTALSTREAEYQRQAREVYEERLAAGVAREQARKDLPLSTYTEAYWKVDLHNLFHFLALRMDGHAQLEIRSYANTIGNEIVRRWVPLAWEAFVDYRLNGVELSRVEAAVLAALSRGATGDAIAAATQAGLLPESGQPRTRNRERDELETKLTALGIALPWYSDEHS